MTSDRFVGRSAELAELSAALEEAISSRPSLALVGGESGVGKSRLADELARHAREAGVRVLSGDCVELGDDELPYAPLLTALRPLVRQGDPSLQALAPQLRSALDAILPGVGGGAASEHVAQSTVFEALLAVLQALSEEEPVLLVIEDLHWADSSTRSFIGFLSHTMCRERLLIVGTYRSDELHRRHPLRPLLAELGSDPYTRLIELPRFTREELSEQLAGILADPPRAELVERVFARSEGNALYSEEILAAGPDGRGALPPTLRDALMLRVERLSKDAQQVLQWLACQPAADHALVAAVAGLEPGDLRDALREAVASHIVVTVADDSYGFRHALLREVVYDDLLPGERTAMHAALAQAMQDRIDAGEAGAHITAAAAHHWASAGDQPQALAAAVRAAVAAERVNAFGEELALFERALALWERVPDPEAVADMSQIDLLKRAAFAADQAGDPARQEALLRRAFELVGEDAQPRACALLRERLSQSLWSQHRQDEAIEELKRGLALFPEGDQSEERATLLSQLAKKRMLQARLTEATDDAEEALAIARVSGNREAEGRALNALGTALGMQGEVETGVRLLRESLDIASELGHAMDIGRRLGQHRGCPEHRRAHARGARGGAPGPRGGVEQPVADRRLAAALDRRVPVLPRRLGRGRVVHPGREPAPHRRHAAALAGRARDPRTGPRRPCAGGGGAVRDGPRGGRNDRAAVRGPPRDHARRAGAPERGHRQRPRGDRRHDRPDRVLLGRPGPDHRGSRHGPARGGRRRPAGARPPGRGRRPARARARGRADRAHPPERGLSRAGGGGGAGHGGGRVRARDGQRGTPHAVGAGGRRAGSRSTAPTPWRTRAGARRRH